MDSEVLDVQHDGGMLYRVYDEIFEATIAGNTIGPPKLLTKGEDVPEVHWAFWSASPATPAPAKPGRGGGSWR